MKIKLMILISFISGTFYSCSDLTKINRIVSKDIPISTKSPTLKAHMKNGSVYIFSSWKVNDSTRTVIGNGDLYDFNRKNVGQDFYTLFVDSVILFETNVREPSSVITPMTLMTGISVVGSVICITNPKACFGSCPTFYINKNGKEYLQAEGFSSSISPSLEATDIDALYFANPKENKFELVMKNEALETHVVRSVNLLLVPKTTERSIQDIDGKFWQTEKLISPKKAISDEGNILDKISSVDGSERFSYSDEKNLKSEEFIDLEFEIDPTKKYGLVLSGRQTLLTTFLLYQAFAYMGNDYGSWLSLLEQNNNLFDDVSPERFLEGIEVQQSNNFGFWSTAGEIHEFGPLAEDLHMVVLPQSTDLIKKIRLKLNQGNWRIDYIGLAELGNQTQPITIQPTTVISKNQENAVALEALTNPSKTLTTLPGDEYKIIYELPDDYSSYSYFLESSGYYLEWMRDEWAKEQSSEKLIQLIRSPEKSLKELAPKYKELEPSMEKVFWNSKYAH